jgi:hypothetical protein
MHHCSGSVGSVPGMFFLGPPGSASGSVSQRYGSEDPDPHHWTLLDFWFPDFQ